MVPRAERSGSQVVIVRKRTGKRVTAPDLGEFGTVGLVIAVPVVIGAGGQ